MATTSIVGVESLYYAVVTEDASGVATYGTPKQLGYVQELKVTPKVDTASQYGDNKVIETATSLGEIDLEITLTGILPDANAEILGHQYGNGTIVKSVTDIAPYVALMYKRTKANGKSRYKVLYKGIFELNEEDTKSKEDKVEFAGEKFKATFQPRTADGVFEFQLDEDMATGTEATTAITNWFTQVQEPTIPATI